MTKPTFLKFPIIILLCLFFNSLIISQNNRCLNFDGLNDLVTIPSEVSESIGSNDFTLEANINGLENGNATGTILSNRTGTNSGFHFFIHPTWGGSQYKMLSLRYNNINWLLIDNGEFDAALLDGKCHHVAVTQSNGLISFYIDGSLIGTKGGGTTPNLDMDTGAPILIGNDGHSNDAFEGTINDVRIWNVARTESEIQDGYTNGVDPDNEGLLGYWELQDGEGQAVVDLTGQNVAFLGNLFFEDNLDPEWGANCCIIPPESGMCLDFDGFDDSVAIPSEVGQSLGSNDFTLEATINGLEDDNLTGTILSNRTSTNSGFHFFIHTTWGGSQHKMLSLRYNSINWLLIDNGEFDAAVLDGKCHHVAVTQSNGLISFYIDGSLIGTKGGGTTPNLDMDTGSPILIGNDPHSNDAFDGTINDVRIWNVARTESEIQDGLANGVDPDKEGLLGHWGAWEGSGQTVADLTNQNDATLGNSASEDDSDPTWGAPCCVLPPVETGDCLSFDGQFDFATIPSAVSESLGNNDFTLEAHITGWEGANLTGTILSNRTSTNSGFHFFVHPTWGGSQYKMLSLRYNSINWLLIDNGEFDAALLDGNCHHVAVTQSNGLISFYIDGSLIGTKGGGTTPNLDMDTGAPILIGNDGHSNDAFNGTIDDVRIWSVVRSESEILDGMENGVDPKEEGLLGYWAMSEGSGQILADYTNQNDAYLGSQSDTDFNDPTWGGFCCGPEIVLDIDDLENEFSNVSIFPNPSDGVITIDFNAPFVANKYKYIVYDNMGRTIIKDALSTSSINLSYLITGQYWLKIYDSSEILSVKKVTIAR